MEMLCLTRVYGKPILTDQVIDSMHVSFAFNSMFKANNHHHHIRLLMVDKRSHTIQ